MDITANNAKTTAVLTKIDNVENNTFLNINIIYYYKYINYDINYHDNNIFRKYNIFWNR